MKITEIKTFVIDCYRTNWVFVKVATDEGIHGIGEGTLEYKENALVGAIADLEHALVGKDPFDTEWIFHENYRDAYWRGGPVLMSALSAVDMALWDIKGKALNLAKGFLAMPTAGSPGQKSRRNLRRRRPPPLRLDSRG